MDSQNWFKSYVVQILPLIAFVIYIWGFAYYVAFYREFGLNIINYISLNEVFVSALVPIVCVTALMLWVVTVDLLFPHVFNTFSWRNKKKVVKFKMTVEKANEKMDNSSGRTPMRKLNSLSFLFIISVCLCAGVYCFDEISLKWKFWSIIIFLLILLACVRDYYKASKKVSPIIIRKLFPKNVAAVILTVLIVSFFVGYSDAERLKHNEGKNFSMTFIDGQLVTADDMKYVGETYSTIFLYDPVNDETNIVNKEAVKSISVVKGKSIFEIVDCIMSK